MFKIIALFYLFLGFFDYCFAAHSPEFDKIVVKRSAYDNAASLYSGERLTASKLKRQTSGSLPDVLDYISSVDLRQRGAFGVQSDLTLRGSTYEQVTVAIDGINIGDPQTGHYSLDLPLTSYDIENIDVAKVGFSSVYGTGALAGAANFITKKPQNNSFLADIIFGDFNLYGQAFSLSRVENKTGARVSFDHKKSQGARPDTGFDYKTGSFYLARSLENGMLDFLFGFQKKDFGASAFYSNLYPEEQEHTRTQLVRSNLSWRFQNLTLNNAVYFRRHWDKFILNKNNPTSVNYHTNYIYGWIPDVAIPTRIGELSLGLDTGTGEINSTNLGKHSRLHEAGLFGFSANPIGGLAADFKFRLDHYQAWPWQKSFNLGLGYKINDSLYFKTSLSRAFRIPSFTDLYYSDPANKGNPDLGVEKTDNFAFGADLNTKCVDLSVDLFLRRGRDLIDWTRQTEAQVWQATNLGRVDFRGVDFNVEFRPDIKIKAYNLKSCKFAYTYTDADKKTSGFLSKYALDILKHNFLVQFSQRLCALDVDLQFFYKQRYYGNTYLYGNFYLAKRFTKRSFVFEPFFKIDNFTNTKYYEINSVVQPGRWIQSGIKFEW